MSDWILLGLSGESRLRDLDKVIDFIRKYGGLIGYLGAIATFGIGIYVLWSENDTIGVLIVIAGLGLASTNFIYNHIDTLKKRIEYLLPIRSLFSSDNSGVSAMIAERAFKTFKDNISAIRQGTIVLEKDAEFFQALVDIVACAEHTVHAVDQIGFDIWNASPLLAKYLSCQKEAIAKSIKIYRIRIVDENQIRDSNYRRQLEAYVEKQQMAGIHLLLCFRRYAAETCMISLEKG
jgi:hypothetical protein